MNTPITDAAVMRAGNCFESDPVVYAWKVRTLELDRAALMDALQEIAARDWIENALSPQDAAGIAERALSTARANFP